MSGSQAHCGADAFLARVPRTFYQRLVWLGLVCACKATGSPPAPHVEPQAPAAIAVAVPVAAGPDVLAELRAAFTELRDVEPVPQLELPAWLSRGTLWLALDGGCKPLWRQMYEPPVNRYIEFCRTVTAKWRAQCTQHIAVGETFVVSGHHLCWRGSGRGGSGGSYGHDYNLVYPSGTEYPETVVRREGLYIRPLVWSAIAADDEHIVYAESWEYAVRDEARTRVESTCEPGSLERAQARLRSELPGASPQALAAALLRRHGVGADALRGCVVAGDLQLLRDRHAPVMRFGTRIRNLPGEALVDCAAPCPDDEARHDRFQAYLRDRRFVARERPLLWIVYASRQACEASMTRSSLRFDHPGCSVGP